jgi:hypothetical protein
MISHGGARLGGECVFVPAATGPQGALQRCAHCQTCIPLMDRSSPQVCFHAVRGHRYSSAPRRRARLCCGSLSPASWGCWPCAAGQAAGGAQPGRRLGPLRAHEHPGGSSRRGWRAPGMRGPSGARRAAQARTTATCSPTCTTRRAASRSWSCWTRARWRRSRWRACRCRSACRTASMAPGCRRRTCRRRRRPRSRGCMPATLSSDLTRVFVRTGRQGARLGGRGAHASRLHSRRCLLPCRSAILFSGCRNGGGGCSAGADGSLAEQDLLTLLVAHWLWFLSSKVGDTSGSRVRQKRGSPPCCLSLLKMSDARVECSGCCGSSVM